MTESWTFVDGHTEGGANLTLAPEDPTGEFTTITFNSVADTLSCLRLITNIPEATGV